MLDKSDVRRQKKLKLRQICHHICPRPKGRKFLTTKKFVLATKSKNVGASWPRGFFLKSSPVRFKEKPREHLSVDTWGRFLKGGINYTSYNSYSMDKSAIVGITIPGIKMGSRKHYLSLE